ncbi:hypothetical protein [Paraprevotella clara]|jgi:hypothetical protein|uniref:hypothetical protein n=1 Tax=Paraprevotella clara TaxID=454154 RepID=UPI00205016EE|nr:hypothetical protein [Paraprevotella clara]DAJ72448.1 MAG TPA: hypothetical protein [Caudoviricetes sp.]
MAKTSGGVRNRESSRQKSIRDLGNQYRRLLSRTGAEWHGRLGGAYLRARRSMEKIAGDDIDKRISVSKYTRR